MAIESRRTRTFWRDLLAGFIAITAVLIVAIRAAVVGSDLRVLFAISMGAFFLAGLLRGSQRGKAWARGLVLSSPGLLGTAALIMNDGVHRWPIPVMISVVSILFATLGVLTRRAWKSGPVRGLTYGVVSTTALVLIAFLMVPPLVTYASIKNIATPTRRFAIRIPSGELVSSDAIHGRVVVLASWASWCLPCRWELLDIDRAYRHFEGDPRVAFFAVDRLGAEETPVRAKRYLEQSRISVPLAFEDAGFSEAFSADALPEVVVLDTAGRTRLLHRGYDASEHLDDILTRTVRQLLIEAN